MDRVQAGQILAQFLAQHLNITDNKDWLVIFLPRWGLPVAKEVGKILNIPIYPLIVKKLAPLDMPEYGFGAMDPDGNVVYDESYMNYLWVDTQQFELIKQKVYNEILKRIQKYSNWVLPDVKEKNIILVDDGVATWYTVAAAATWIRNHWAKKIILAVPVCPVNIDTRLSNFFDQIICLYPRQDFQAVGQYYQDFHQIEDDEYFKLLQS